ncbi:hypothetical protein BOTBODRAFT_45212 [Botryobasidium botryosum FD-172 SS1]|uniref:Uncharacterized protein n=1 Tax=Botryobasidium botryosum (strain FD-172 SS1) TaxID=930990 RepID=A0A067MDA6_BOTB1|nr:hypothetical protein BOTBODRAFT_45212 [Botryobasidium botryosum FD-172 SS1]
MQEYSKNTPDFLGARASAETTLPPKLLPEQSDHIHLSEPTSLPALIATLLDDVLALVFAVGHNDQLQSYMRGVPVRRFGDTPGCRALTFATAVSHVCRHWRVVAVSTAMLWRNIRIGRHTKLEHAMTWADRSKSAPLSFMFEEGSGVHQYDFYRTLNSHFSRCSELHLQAYPFTIFRILKWFDGGKAPSLQNVTLHAIGEREEDVRVEDLLANIPTLKSLRIYGTYGMRPPFTPNLLAQLSELALHHPCDDNEQWHTFDWWSLLSSCSGLEILVLDDLPDSEVHLETHPTPHLPRLRSLSLRKMNPSQLLSFLLNIDAPQLRRLQLTCYDVEYSLHSVSPSLANKFNKSVLPRHTLPAQELVIDWPCGAELMGTLLMHLPLVETLTSVNTNSILALRRSPIPLPHLRNLILPTCSSSQVARSLRSLIESRRAASSAGVLPIRSLTIESCQGRSLFRTLKEDEAWFLEVLEEYSPPPEPEYIEFGEAVRPEVERWW